MSTLTENKKLTDVLTYEVDNGLPGFCREEATIKNALGSNVTITDPCGTPLVYVTDHYELMAAGDEASLAGILLETEDIGALSNGSTTTKKYPILVRGPAIVKKAGLATADEVAASYTMADLITAAMGLGIRVDTEPTKTNSTSP